MRLEEKGAAGSPPWSTQGAGFELLGTAWEIDRYRVVQQRLARAKT